MVRIYNRALFLKPRLNIFYNSSRVWPLSKLESFFKDTIDKCGKGVGLMLAVLIPNNARIEDIQAMMKSVREYGRIKEI
jgi:hypothetical protein